MVLIQCLTDLLEEYLLSWCSLNRLSESDNLLYKLMALLRGRPWGLRGGKRFSTRGLASVSHSGAMVVVGAGLGLLEFGRRRRIISGLARLTSHSPVVDHRARPVLAVSVLSLARQ